ncbi:uncharacterized protein V1518DRAFT_421026 [Limtongia smithiae]|uniref:uncharacterized protein n=1 Tax=Limtongia smithiae TaxID=1125753 RepID=UPI0034CF9388
MQQIGMAEEELSWEAAELSEATLLRYTALQAATHDTDRQVLLDNERISNIQLALLEHKNAMLQEERAASQSSLEAELHTNVQIIAQLRDEIAQLEVNLKAAVAEQSQTIKRLKLAEKREQELSKERDSISDKLVDQTNKIATDMKKTQSGKTELIEQKFKYNELLQEKLATEQELAEMNLEVTSLRARLDKASSATEGKLTILEKKFAKSEQELKSSIDKLKNSESKNADLKTQCKELETKYKQLEKQLQSQEKVVSKERDASTQKEIKVLEMKHKEEVAALKSQLATQTTVSEKLKKELQHHKDDAATKQKTLETKVEALQLKLKSVTASNRSRPAAAHPAAKPADRPALLFTPEVSKMDTRKAANANNRGVDKLLAKSTFSMTPFLQRQQTKATPLSPVNANAAAGRALETSVPTVTKPAETEVGADVTAHDVADQNNEEQAADADNENTEVAKGAPPAQKARVPRVRKNPVTSLADMVSEEIINSNPKKRRRKLGGATKGPTLFDDITTVPEQAKRGGLDLSGFDVTTTKLAAPVAQRAFLGNKEISPLKKRNENLREITELNGNL